MFTRKEPVLDELLLKRVAVNGVENGQVWFTGRFARYDENTFVFEQCETYPGPGETAAPIKGVQYVDRIHVFPTGLP